ncbi:uncharacterized protein LOC116029767 [Ipomoea triloba]|uniref:uncharacterized protein LOC116029767 n=1 Tax=Ipomoea triloba TaxID=35885 RepID=UPI00125E8AF1|nr:uncharacterized protein LOC116029767 [Ipomoea triloba]
MLKLLRDLKLLALLKGFTGNNLKLISEFREALIKRFEIIDMGIMCYFLGLEVVQIDGEIFISLKKYVADILKKFKMENSKPVLTPIVEKLKVSKDESVRAMDPQTLAENYAALSIAAEDEGGLDAPDVDQPSGSVVYYELVGKLLTDRPVKFEHMQQILASVWRPLMGVRVIPLEENLFSFQLPHQRDMFRVLDDGPWSFENQTLVCNLVPPRVRPEEIILDSVDFWVQIHDLPTVYANAAFVQDIGNYVGVFVKVDPNNFGGHWKSFFRIRVSLKVTEPLKRRMKLRLRDGSSYWVLFKYERLNTFCFCCGLLGHSDKFCRKAYLEGIEPKDYPYGSGLRAGLRRSGSPSPPCPMSTLSWNCRGLGGPQTVRELLGFVSSQRPNFVFLMETKAQSAQLERLKIRLGYEGLFTVDRVGLGGGLALFWHTSDMASLLSYSGNHIDVIVTLADKPPWRLTCFYGFPERSRRQQSWDLLKDLKDRSSLPWVMIGDFNDIANHGEKRGHIPHPDNLIRGFNETLQDCELSDLVMRGHEFTWTKGRGTDHWIEERLDRAVVSMEWRDLYDDAYVQNLHAVTSDHSAIFLSLHGYPTWLATRKFKFESAWLLDANCRQVVEASWHQSAAFDFQQRIINCGQDLWRWGADHFRKFGKKIQQLRGRLENLKRSSVLADITCFHEVEVELRTLLTQEEIYWRQRSKQLWLKEGDSNTKYFHRFASHRRKTNHLQRLKDSTGCWVEGDGMHNEIVRYYEEIFKTVEGDRGILVDVPTRLSQATNDILLQPVESDEVRTALFSMAPNKAPGPDGMMPSFYQSFWTIVGYDLTAFVSACFNNRALPVGLNVTNMVLISKKKIPERVSDLRPIALCNVVYKVLAKVVANRLKTVLNGIVSSSQSAFVPGRLISDNIILAGEVGHYLRTKRYGNVGWAALKLDMAKAYDRMEWGYLEGMLLSLGFAQQWVELIRMCVTSVSYNILVNGASTGMVVPSRGIRQGDPLSPYLFIICAEGLSLLFQQQEARGNIHGVRVARGAPSISHLFFADDSLLFFKATAGEAQEVKNCLRLYGDASGQLVNFDKSSVTFSMNTTPTDCTSIARIFGVRQANDFGKYIGLPSFLGRNKTAVFRYIEQRIRERINGWQKKLLSRAGKEVLLKSIAQAMPLFSMSVFLLPLNVCDSIEKVMNAFWWNTKSSSSRGIHWLSWSRLAIPKSNGGLGFKRLHEFNVALLTKQGWRLLVNPHALVSRVLKAKYFPKTCFLEANIGHNPSYLWRSILAGQKVLRKGVIRRVGNGVDTLVWGWPWLADSTDSRLHTPCIEELKDTHVSNLLDNNDCWDEDLLRDIFYERDVVRILRTPTSPNFMDTWCWKGDIKGSYTVKHGYHIQTSHLTVHGHGLDILPVLEILRSKGVAIGGGCPFCAHATESISHILCECPLAAELWGVSDILQGRSFVHFVEAVLHATDGTQVLLMAARFWTTWKARNDKIWNGRLWSVDSLKRQVDALVAAWKQYYHTPSVGLQRSTQSLDFWMPPPSGKYKCNVDAALFATGVAFGAVVRDSNGKFVAACGGSLLCVSDPFVAEAMAIKEALTWIKDRGMTHVILETDCLNFCNSFNSILLDLSYVGLIIKQCKLIARDIGDIVVHHVRRSANQVAHVLARAAGSFPVLSVWDSYPPDCISSLVAY